MLAEFEHISAKNNLWLCIETFLWDEIVFNDHSINIPTIATVGPQPPTAHTMLRFGNQSAKNNNKKHLPSH